MRSKGNPRVLALALLMGLTAAPVVTWSAPVAPFTFDSAYGRLPKNVIPLDYQVAITPDAAALALAGEERVLLDFRQSTDTVILNSLNEVFSNVRLDGVPVKGVVSSDEQQLTTITLGKPASVGRHTLTFSYKGKIETTPVGLFYQPFVAPGGQKGMLLSTQFEPTDARRMFPCWDEPAFRATVELTATVPAAWVVVSNMPVARRSVRGDLAVTTFGRTPKMPTYLVEFSAGDLARISATSGKTELSVWAIRGQEKDGAVALANAQQILADYNDYFGYAFPLPKLDSIAVPGGFTGAMENWGAITYNDQLLLVNASSTLNDRQEIFSIQAHEMAHQWNGDLVTMGWWDDLWLNESFASWRAAKETDFRNPEWKWWETQDADKEGAMRADARISSHAIAQHVTNELQAANAFDSEITYSKGQAVLRMLEAHLGDDVFRDGVRRFMKAHAYSNASSTDLWNALGDASGRDVARIASGWIERPGFPLVSVAAACDAAGKRSIRLSQQRFLLQASDAAAAPWQVPLQIRVGSETKPRPALLTTPAETFEAGRCDEPLSVNAGAIGYYRVAYDAATLSANTLAFATLPSADRIALLDDQWALFTAGRQGLAEYLKLASRMGSDLDQRAWSQMNNALASIERNLRGQASHDAFAAYARTLLQPVADRLGWQGHADESSGTQKLRRAVLVNLGTWGDTAVIDEARRRFAAFAVDRTAIPPDDQEMVLAIVARNADAARYDQLHAIARAARNDTELQRYYTALMQVRDPVLAAQAARVAVSDEFPEQAQSVRMGLVIELAVQNPQLAWTTFTQNLDLILKPQGQFAPMMVAQYAPDVFWEAAPPDTIEAWVRAHAPAEMADSIARGMESARFNVAQKSAMIKAVGSFLDTGATAARPASGSPAGTP